MRAPQAQREADIPDKLYFRIGEVSRLAGVKPHVLRYWESEFPSISPRKSGRGHRLYRRKDVELILEIKRLLYDQRYTIEGARKHLEGRGRRLSSKPPAAAGQADLFGGSEQLVGEIRRELEDILNILSEPK